VKCYENLIAKLLRKKDKFEALSWLEKSGASEHRNVAELTNAQSIELIRELYMRGATKVWAVKFDRSLPYESINTLIVELPIDSLQRMAVFDWEKEQAERQGFDVHDDYGQHFLHVWFD
jgi:hypothetical protein